MLVTIMSMVLVTAWALVISLIWVMVRKFHRSKPPGRQTVRIGLQCSALKAFSWKVVTDLICFCTFFFNLNVVLTGFLVNYRLSQELVTLPDLSCNIVSSDLNQVGFVLIFNISKFSYVMLVWEASCTIIMGCGSCVRWLLTIKQFYQTSYSALSASQWLTPRLGFTSGALRGFTGCSV